MAALCALSLLPLRLALEANGDWRLAHWTLGFAVSGLGLLAFHHAGGGAWTRHFAFPLLFSLVAIPWPSRLEFPLVQGLMQIVTAVTVDALNWVGIPAVQQGNVIELADGMVGIAEACSGIRSLQASLMIALFLGERSRLPAAGRIALAGAAAATVFGMNLVRTFTLTLICARHGVGALERWHDESGYSVLVIAFAVVGALAAIWEQGIPSRPETRSPLAPRRMPIRTAALLVVWLLATEGITETWYRLHERHLAPAPSWSVAWPGESASFQQESIDDRTRRRLQCDEIEAGVFSQKDGARWKVFFMKWLPGGDLARVAAHHIPEGCLPSAGWKLGSMSEPFLVTAHGIPLSFRAYRFSREGAGLVVFQTRWEMRAGRVPGAESAHDFQHGERLRMVLEGRRNPGVQVLEIAVFDAGDSEQPKEKLAEFLRKIIRRP